MKVGLDNLKAPYDLIVIGAGPAGLTLARKYEALTGHKTLLIESGHRSRVDSDAQKLSFVETTGDPDSDYYTLHSQRVFGGTSTVWSGWCAVLEKRAFLNNEWPLDYDELHAFYPEAADILGVPDTAITRPETPFPDNANIVYKPYYLHSGPSVTESFANLIDHNPNVDVLFNHTVTGIGIRGGMATSVLVQESSVKSHRPGKEIVGARIVLAGGGVQNARLLQLSLPRNNRLPIGAYFCEHPHIYRTGKILLDKEKYDHIWDRRKYPRGIIHAIALSSEFSNRYHLPSTTFSLRNHDISTRNILGQKREVLIFKPVIRAEMIPLATNRISLSDDRKDFLGQPVGRINLKFDREAIRTVHNALNAELVRSGIGRLNILPEEFKGEFKIGDGGGHFMGATRMGDDPEHSVTDAQGRVHGMENLYVAGSSLFPSVGAANPTLTIVALSLRLANYLGRVTK